MFYCSIKARISLKDLNTEYFVLRKAALNFWGGFFLVSRLLRRQTGFVTAIFQRLIITAHDIFGGYNPPHPFTSVHFS
jgi:hypothetical protein